MSWIGNNLLGTPFAGFSPTGTQSPLEEQPVVNPARASAGAAPFGAPAWNPTTPLGGADSNGLGGIMSGFLGFINNLFGQIASWYQSSAAGSPGVPPNPGTPAEQLFGSASASSWGDPHETFNGTTSGGQNVAGAWDSMCAHPDLLDSDSFAGGYRIATQVTQPNAQGVTLNQSATITTDSGNTVVSMNASGQCQISSYGRNVTLAPGQSAQLGRGESVTLNTDGSLTVSDTNAQGGSIVTTLQTNGSGGVDVKTQASNVDLGGYLVTRSDGPSNAPTGPSNPPGARAPWQPPSNPAPWQPPFNPAPSPGPQFPAQPEAASGALDFGDLMVP